MRYSNPLRRLLDAARYSLNGLRYAWKAEQAFEYEVIVLFVLIAVSLSAGFPLPVAAVVAGGWLFVMALELVNSAVERAFDLIDARRRPEIKAGKDMLSAAVFLMILFNAGLWVIIFLKTFFS